MPKVSSGRIQKSNKAGKAQAPGQETTRGQSFFVPDAPKSVVTQPTWIPIVPPDIDPPDDDDDVSDSGVILSSKLTLTATQVANLQSSPITFDIAAPGVGKILVPVSFIVQYKIGLALPALNLYCFVDYDGTTQGPFEAKVYLGDVNRISFSAIENFPDIENTFENTQLVFTANEDLGVFGPISSSSITPGQHGEQYVVGDTGFINTYTDDSTYIVTSVKPGGYGYAVNDTGFIVAGNNDATYIVDSVDGNGTVLTFTLTVNGSSYDTTANVGTVPTLGTGFGLTLDIATISSGNPLSGAILSLTGGAVSGYTILNPGTTARTADGWITTPNTGIGTGLYLDLVVSGLPQTGTMQVDLLYRIIDLF